MRPRRNGGNVLAAELRRLPDQNSFKVRDEDCFSPRGIDRDLALYLRVCLQPFATQCLCRSSLPQGRVLLVGCLSYFAPTRHGCQSIHTCVYLHRFFSFSPLASRRYCLDQRWTIKDLRLRRKTDRGSDGGLPRG